MTTENNRVFEKLLADLSIENGDVPVQIPQVRGMEFYPQSLEKGCRSEKALKLAIAQMYIQGVSTRRVTKIVDG